MCQRCANAGPVNTRLRCGAGRYTHRGYAAPTIIFGRRLPSERADQRLANRDDVSLGKKPPKSFPIFIVSQGTRISPYRLIDIHTQRRVESSGDASDISEPQIVGLHHDGDHSYRHAEPATAIGLLMNEFPVTCAALLVLFSLGRIVEREFDIMKCAHMFIVQYRDAVTVGRYRQLHRFVSQIIKDGEKLRMHSILSRSEVDRPNRQMRHHIANLVQCQTINAIWISVTERAGENA